MTRDSLRHGASPARALLCFTVMAAVVALPLPGHPAPVKPYTCIALGTLGGDYSSAKAVNDTGEVVGVTTFVPGTVTFNRDERAFAWRDANGNNASDPGEMVFLGSLGYNSWANGLNNLGEAVGSSKYSNTVATDQRAILWDIRQNPPTMTDLNTLLTPGIRPPTRCWEPTRSTTGVR